MTRASVVNDGDTAFARQYEAIRSDYARRVQVPATYVIWKQDGTYYADHCLETGTDYSGAVASTVIQAAINAMGVNGGGKIFIKAGTYSLTAPITLYEDDLTIPLGIWGEGGTVNRPTILYLANGSNCDVMRSHTNPTTAVDPNWGIHLRDLCINGNKANNPTGGHGLHICATWSLMENVEFRNCKTNGYELTEGNTTAGEIYDNRLFNCTSRGHDGIGYHIDEDCSDGYMELVNAAGCGSHGIHLQAGNWKITDGHLYVCTGRALYLQWSSFAVVKGVTFERCAMANGHQLGIDGSHHVNIENCTFYSNADAAITYDHINLDSSSACTISNNQVETGTNKPRQFLRAWAAIDCIVFDNIVTYMTGDGIWMGGCVGNDIHDNRIFDSSGGFGINLDGTCDYNTIHHNYTDNNNSGCVNIGNVNCDNNKITDNNFDEGNIANAGTNTRAWLNYDPSANVFIVTINPPAVVGGGGGNLP